MCNQCWYLTQENNVQSGTLDATYEDGKILTQSLQKSDNSVGFNDLLLNNKLYLYPK